MDDDAREVLSVAGIAHRFDADLLDLALSDDDIVDRCQRAVELGLASVVCRPHRVAVAARAVEGSDVAVCTGLNVRYDAWSDPSLPELARATDQAVEDGARDLTLFMARSQLQPENADRLTAQLTHVAASAAACGGLARVVLMTSGMTCGEIRDGCRLAVSCGVDMVQGGAATTGDRASLSQLTQMRRELGAGVLLKWMAPVRSLDWFLVARAEGVDRFWGGVEYVLEQARDRQSWGEQIRVPRPGVDY